MYKLLAVDNEPLILNSIELIVKKYMPNTFEVRRALSGSAAILLADEYNPDVVFIDILMPGINGLDAIAAIKGKHPRTRFIVITAYDDFAFAKTAIKLGVDEYLLKPVNKDILLSCLQKMITQLDEERAELKEQLAHKERQLQIQPVIETQLIQSLLFYNGNAESLRQGQSLLGIEISRGIVMCIDYAGADSLDAHGVETDGAIATELRQYLKSFVSCILSNVLIGRMVAVLLCAPEQSIPDIEILALSVAARVHKHLERSDLTVRVGIGSVFRAAEETNSSYEHANIALSHAAPGCSIKYSDIVISTRTLLHYPHSVEVEFLENLAVGNARCMDAFEVLFQWFVKTYHGDTQRIKLGLLPLLNAIDEKTRKNADPNTNMEQVIKRMEDYLGLQTTAVVHDSFARLVDRICNDAAAKRQDNRAQVVGSVTDYIDAHYMDVITLDDMAARVSFSPAYFSSIFHKETGTVLMSYVANVRMAKAKELMLDESLSIKEIASRVGYPSPNYFGRLFKKMYGISPSEYISMQKNRSNTFSKGEEKL